MDEIQSFWQAYLDCLPGEAETGSLTYTAWSFGNRPGLADELGALVLAGLKTATCTLLWEAEQDDDMPCLGGLSLVLDGNRRPLCIIQTTEVAIKPFDEIDAQFAYAEGEGDRTYEYWRADHWRYFAEICASRGLEMRGSMPIVCERFRLVYPEPPNL